MLACARWSRWTRRSGFTKVSLQPGTIPAFIARAAKRGSQPSRNASITRPGRRIVTRRSANTRPFRCFRSELPVPVPRRLPLCHWTLCREHAVFAMTWVGARPLTKLVLQSSTDLERAARLGESAALWLRRFHAANPLPLRKNDFGDRLEHVDQLSKTGRAAYRCCAARPAMLADTCSPKPPRRCCQPVGCTATSSRTTCSSTKTR